MEDFEWEGTELHPIVSTYKGCSGCYFIQNGRDCRRAGVPICREEKVYYIFIEASQNALQQEQETSS